jgi:pepF/M3 family oligoendopeptidase
MWSVIDAKSAKLLNFFGAKAKLMGLERLSWFDAQAPVGEVTREFTYGEAADFVVDNLHPFNPDIAGYSRMAIDQRWIEAEDRSGKRAGAYCTNLPLTRESRIFMTYNGSYNGMLTLAHELGHGYHTWVMRDLPYGARRYTMSVAETASTFNEIVVRDASLVAAASDQEQLSILGTKLNDATAYLMNIRARFDFEMAFFEQRVKKPLTVDELSELMLKAQKAAFKEGLADYHPLFWASKLHFYITRAPFYNFPYTFGYLFSNGVYAQALVEGPAFQERYIALLRDTGSMTTEDLARTHLGVDLTRPEFWETAVDRVLADVDKFVALVNQRLN